MLSGESVSIIVTDVVDAARADPIYLAEKRESSFMKVLCIYLPTAAASTTVFSLDRPFAVTAVP